MRSIRFSLLAYFLVLLAIALGAVSLLAYQQSERIVEDKELLRAELLKQRFQRQEQILKVNLDRAIGWQARILANQWQSQYQRSYVHNISRQQLSLMSPIAILGSAVVKSAILAGDVPNQAAASSLYAFTAAWLDVIGSEIQIDEEALHQPMNWPAPSNRRPETRSDLDLDPLTVYFKINTEWGGVWRSKSMNHPKRVFLDEVDGKRIRHLQVMQVNQPSEMDDAELEPGQRVRRVTFKANRFAGWAPRSGGGQRAPFDRRGAPGRLVGPERPPPNDPPLLIQFAADTSALEAKLAASRKDYEQSLANLKAESRETLASLMNWLLFISMVTFAATVVGLFILVRTGLSPLQRLSEAVSKVTVKDFRLPFDDRRLPAELRPIVGRLVQTLDLLKRTFAREKQAAADISHDLRTPLAALLTTIEVGLKKERTPQQYRDMLSDCHAAGQQISYLVERLLALARLDSGVDTLRPRSIDVADLAEQCANLVKPLADARELTVRVHRDGPLTLSADPDKLREIVTNLLHNAIEYNQPHGSVDLTVERHNGSLLLEVRDTGIGIAPEAREQIFERFYRADSSRHSDGMHAGLGLAIVKGYVDLMGGKIDVQSTVGEGSVFRLELPA